MPDGLHLALTTLTVARLRRSAPLDRRTAGRAMTLAPLVGLGLAVTSAGLVFLLRVLHAPDLLAAVLMIALLALLTRGLHLDGLLDVVDGLASYRDPEGTRTVMKRADAGPLGVAALVLVLLLQTAALSSAISQHRGTLSLCVAVMTGRLAITAACARTPAAVPEGLGALVAQTVRTGVTSAWCVALVAAGALALAADPDAVHPAWLRADIGAAAVLLGLLAARLVRQHVVRRVGGLTGDVLGALNEVATTVALLVLALGATTTAAAAGG
ncbi:MAG TPA: adenosylcobinamide-GDP ribazoletransferase [Mycobacteriales bacterium]|nr:adenosylcobinamide-GDP ribazoletransferase [Mycobacteriales bacterium]